MAEPIVFGAPYSVYLRAAPMITKFRMAPEGARLLDEFPGLARWWDGMAKRPSPRSRTGL